MSMMTAETRQQKVCVQCDQPFQPIRVTARTCSNRCRQARFRASRRVTHKLICERCSQLFESGRRNVRYCSPACKQSVYRKRANGRS